MFWTALQTHDNTFDVSIFDEVELSEENYLFFDPTAVGFLSLIKLNVNSIININYQMINMNKSCLCINKMNKYDSFCNHKWDVSQPNKKIKCLNKYESSSLVNTPSKN